MNDLKQIVSTFSSDEQQQFINYLERKNKRNDTKNIQLFKLLSKQELDSKAICLKLYKTNKSNAYHALRKRLYQSIIDFTASVCSCVIACGFCNIYVKSVGFINLPFC